MAKLFLDGGVLCDCYGSLFIKVFMGQLSCDKHLMTCCQGAKRGRSERDGFQSLSTYSLAAMTKSFVSMSMLSSLFLS